MQLLNIGLIFVRVAKLLNCIHVCCAVDDGEFKATGFGQAAEHASISEAEARRRCCYR